MSLLPFSQPLVSARFLRRVKRFSVEVALEDGRSAWAHTNNTGSMLGLLRPGCEVLLSVSANPKRKLPYTLELARGFGGWVGVNTQIPNRMLLAAARAGRLPGLERVGEVRAEAVVGESRLDARIEGPDGPVWVEAKNVTMVEDDVACFPDAVTERGQKHLRELMELARQGARVALFFLVQRPDGRCFGPAAMIDAEYARLYAEALEVGVEMWPHRALISEAGPNAGVGLGERLPLVERDWYL